VILVDTSVWVQHLRRGDPRLVDLLGQEQVVCHPFVIGELAMGSVKNRTTILTLLHRLPSTDVATHKDVLALVERRGLHGAGLGWIDAHLLTAALLAGTRIWTIDRALASAARGIDIDAHLP
jgi:predicted nucleic acid-binding protein